MALTQAEFDTLLDDVTKRIDGDIAWQADEDHSSCMEFKAPIASDAGWPLYVKGTYNPLIPALSYTLILQSEGRIYALDLGKRHHNPSCHHVGDCHKHRWSEQLKDKVAYEPADITAAADAPVQVWRQFCAEARIDHRGTFMAPPARQGELWPWPI